MIFCVCMVIFSGKICSQSMLWKDSFGGWADDCFFSVTTVSDGIVAAGYSNFNSFNTFYWGGVTGKGSDDAIIVKYDNNNNVVWRKNFGGNGDDRYYSVTTVSDGIVAVGYSNYFSFGNGDWLGTTTNCFYDIYSLIYTDAIIVKYDYNGNVVWKKNLGGTLYDYFYYVTAVPDGIIAVGYSSSIGSGDWNDAQSRGNTDAIIVKYDNNGNLVWKKNFGGSGEDYYYSVTTVSDGVIAVGTSRNKSFGNGDWIGYTGKGSTDAIIVKYNFDGNVTWKKNFGGGYLDAGNISGNNVFNSVTTISDGVVAVGYSDEQCFNHGDWAGVQSKGNSYTDAVIVKFNNNGDVVWKKNCGGSGYDYFNDVTIVFDGIVAVGYSDISTYGGGDWAGLTAKGGNDAIIVKYDNSGNIVWKKNLGGSYGDDYKSVTTASNGNIVAVGYSSQYSFNNGDWAGVQGMGGNDATIVKYASFISVTNITNVPTTATIGVPLKLTATVVPNDAMNKNIIWNVKNAGTTGAKISNDTLNVSAAGTVTVTATIKNGTAIGTDYTKDFNIIVSTVGIAKMQGTGLRIFPNPTTGQLIIDNGQLTIKSVEIYNIVGQIVFTSPLSNLSHETTIDISHLANGLYFLKVDGKMVKVVKE